MLWFFVSLPLAGATDVLWSVEAPTGALEFGAAIRSVGDLTGDGIAELAVGAPAVVNQSQQGFLYVYDVASKSLIATRSGQLVGDEYGNSIAPLGDIDGGGTPDFAVGAPSPNLGPFFFGYVEIVYGEQLGSSAPVLTIDSTKADTNFGWRVDSLIANTTGVRDLVVGAPEEGRVYLYEGSDLASYAVDLRCATAAYSNIGIDLANAHDLNGDGIEDFVARDEWEVVRAFSGASCSLLWSTEVPAGEAFQWPFTTLESLGWDITGDGAPEVLASDFLHGEVNVLASEDGAIITAGYEKSGDTMYGYALLADGADFDGWNDLDVAVGEPLYTDGSVVTGNVDVFGLGIGSVLGGSGETYGSALEALDVEGDGIDEIVVATPDAVNPSSTGRIEIISPATSATVPELIGPSPSTVYPSFSLTMTPMKIGDSLHLDIANGPPNAMVYLAISPATAAMSSAKGCNLYFDIDSWWSFGLVTGPAGNVSLNIPLGSGLSSLVGTELAFQGIYSSKTIGGHCTNALAATVGY